VPVNNAALRHLGHTAHLSVSLSRLHVTPNVLLRRQDIRKRAQRSGMLFLQAPLISEGHCRIRSKESLHQYRTLTRQQQMRVGIHTSRSFFVRPRDSTGKRRNMRNSRPPYTMKPPAAAMLTRAKKTQLATLPTSVACPDASAVKTQSPAYNHTTRTFVSD
jgi:hypothetical protein